MDFTKLIGKTVKIKDVPQSKIKIDKKTALRTSPFLLSYKGLANFLTVNIKGLH